MTKSTRNSSTFFERFRQRKVYKYPFLDKKLQFSFAVLFALIGGGNITYMCLLFYFYAQEMFHQLAIYIPDYVLAEPMFQEQTRLFFITVLYIAVTETVLITLWGLFFSHRIAGPIFAIGRKLETISGGRIPEPITLRKHDLIMPLAKQINKVIATFHSQKIEIEEAIKELRSGNTGACEERLKKITR